MTAQPPPRPPASELLRHRFAPGARERGYHYHQRRAVRITGTVPGGVVATVQGTRRYQVEVRVADDSLAVSCTCPAFESGPCKHIWATILTAEERGLLGRDSPGGDPDAKGGRLSGLDLELDDEVALDPATEEELALDADPDPDQNDEWPRPGRFGAWDPRFSPAAARALPRRNEWRDRLDAIARLESSSEPHSELPKGQIVYVVDVPASRDAGSLALEIARRRPSKKGEWSQPMVLRMPGHAILRLPDKDDREILALLQGAPLDDYSSYLASVPRRLRNGLDLLLLPRLCATGRAFVRREPGGPVSSLRWDEGGPWEFWLEMRSEGEQYVVGAQLRRGEVRRPLTDALAVVQRLVIFEGVVSPFDPAGAFQLVLDWRRRGDLRVPKAQGRQAVERFLKRRQRLRLALPPELRLDETRPAPRPRLSVRTPPERWDDLLACELSFDYDGVVVAETDPHWCVARMDERRLVARDPAGEQRAASRLGELGFRRIGAGPSGPGSLRLSPRHLPAAARALLAEGWGVEAEGKIYRPARSLRMEVVSGVDWFDLQGAVDFDGTVLPLPAVLAALQRGETTITLGDGTLGMLPEEWIERYGLMAALGAPEKGALRFRRSQAGLLDVLLAAQEDVVVDRGFEEARAALREFEGVRPTPEPKGFGGVLREYQRQGLGWLHFLDRFAFGGCLADDMGLGKTVQVLALLVSRRGQGGKAEPRPTLVVVPRSLVFNWREEAARFTPQLRILEHVSTGRTRDLQAFAGFDVVLTTYGTLRRDILLLKEVEFDYVVLDEAQAVKNAATDSAKAVRLLRSRRRLALSGTPIENHVGELWSLFEFLNPGMLGRAAAFAGRAGTELDEAQRATLARALRPFILRRTKSEVAQDLPPRVEQTVHCALDAPQRKLYDELRLYYRKTLLARIERDGMGRAKMHVLEALLRLRQAACHPGLVDPKRKDEGSAKLDLLLARLDEVREEGHKALVFSQFTSFLAILREALDARGRTYEYLDGKTRDRGERVRRFQEERSSDLFLISLKAGGLGLNLTAAEYVFLLDPWWNPAVEAQAVDRAHRIGQSRHVFAYRLIARDTIEEKVLDLQARKKDLADALLGAGKGPIGDLRREDLEMLLS